MQAADEAFKVRPRSASGPPAASVSRQEARSPLWPVEATFRPVRQTWGKKPAAERAAALRRVAALVRDRKSELATMESLDMGKPIDEAEWDMVCPSQYLHVKKIIINDDGARVCTGHSIESAFTQNNPLFSSPHAPALTPG